MNLRLALVCFAFPPSFVALGCGSANRAPQLSNGDSPRGGEPPCLSVVAWNDLHGQLSPDAPIVDTGHLPAGGVAALADEVATIRATNDAVVVLDAGDLFTGPMESTLAEGAPVIEAYKIMGVDAVAIGNHEFDFGPVGYARTTAGPLLDDAGADGPRGALIARMRSAPFPFLSANIHRDSGAAPDWPNQLPSTHIRRQGFDVGVVGYTTEQTPTTTLRQNVVGLDFSKSAGASVAREIRALRAAGAGPVILLAHASIEGTLPQSLEAQEPSLQEKQTGELVTLVRTLGPDRPDAIVAGHRHAWMLGRIDGVPMVSSDQHGVGAARIRFCKKGGTPTFDSIERRVVVASAPPRTELGLRVARAMTPWRDAVRAEAESVVTTLAKPCAAQGLNGTAMAEQMARAIGAHVSDAAAAPAGVPVVALTNSGGIRASLAAGPLRYADMFAAFPFENSVAVCATTRAGLLKVLRNALTKPSIRERFPFGLEGARLTLRRDLSGDLEIVKLEIDGAKKDDSAPIWLAIPDFLVDGGDGYLEGVTCASKAISATRVRDAWRELLAREEHGCSENPRNIVVAPP